MKRTCLILLLTASTAHAQRVGDLEPVSDGSESPVPDASSSVELPKSHVDAQIRDLVGQPRYRFCHQPGYRLDRDEQALCPLAEGARARCPVFEEVCAKSQAGGPQERSATTALMSAFGRLLFWGLVLTGLVLVSYQVLSAVVRRRREREAAVPLGDSPVPPGEPSRPTARVTDVDRLLELAEAAAVERRFSDAIRFLHAALLRHLDRGGLVRLDPAWSNGEYVRALADRADLESVLRRVTVAVDRVEFGGWPGTLEAFRGLLVEVTATVRASAVALVACLLFVPLTACSASFGDRSSSHDHSPDGHGLLRELLAQNGTKSHRRVRRLDRIADEVGTVIVLSPQSEESWKTLLAWAEDGGTLVSASEMPPHDVVSEQLKPDSCTAPLTLSAVAQLGEATLGGRRAFGFRIKGSDVWPIIDCGAASYLVATELGEGRLLVFRDGEFLTNASLLVADNAWLLVTLLPSSSGEVEIIDQWTGTAARTPFQALQRGKLTPVVIQLVLLLVVAALWRGVAFGTPRDPPGSSRRSFVEHVRALGVAYAKAQATRLVLGSYAGWALERLRERTQPGHCANLDALVLAVAARTGRPEAEVRDILYQARVAKDEPAPTSTLLSDLTTMRNLEALVSETGVTR